MHVAMPPGSGIHDIADLRAAILSVDAPERAGSDQSCMGDVFDSEAQIIPGRQRKIASDRVRARRSSKSMRPSTAWLLDRSESKERCDIRFLQRSKFEPRRANGQVREAAISMVGGTMPLRIRRAARLHIERETGCIEASTWKARSG